MQPHKSLWWVGVGGVGWRGGVEWSGVEWSESKFSDHSPHVRIVGELINSEMVMVLPWEFRLKF